MDWPQEAVNFPLTAQAANLQVITGKVLLFGWQLSVTAATVAQIIDGYDAKGTPGPAFNFGAAGMNGQWLGDSGLLMERGIYLVVSSGALTGSIFYRRYYHRGGHQAKG